jgi:hypothetical protein
MHHKYSDTPTVSSSQFPAQGLSTKKTPAPTVQGAAAGQGRVVHSTDSP